jgi:hypothetical protein
VWNTPLDIVMCELQESGPLRDQQFEFWPRINTVL